MPDRTTANTYSGGSIPDGWTLKTETERFEVTRGGGPPSYEADVVRQFIPGATAAWLEGPDGEFRPLPYPFTDADIIAATTKVG